MCYVQIHHFKTKVESFRKIVSRMLSNFSAFPVAELYFLMPSFK